MSIANKLPEIFVNHGLFYRNNAISGGRRAVRCHCAARLLRALIR
jgi:hypothetical protein